MKVDSIIDGHKIHLHPDKAAQWLKTGDCYPIHIEIGATGRCDQRCIFCALDFVSHKKDIDKDVMLGALEEMAEHEVKSVMFGGEGEPLLHKDISLFVQKAKNYGLDVALTTNGVTFDQTKREQCLPYLSWIKFSVDAGDKETYAEVHKVASKQFDRLINNIKESVEFKRKNKLEVTIGTQFLMLPQNINTAEKAVKILKDVGADYLSVKPYSNHPRNVKEFFIDNKKYNELEKALEKFSTDKFEIAFRKETIKRIKEGNIYSECHGLPFISLIDSMGNILPCNLFYDNSDFVYGNLYENSFSEIWESEKRKKVLEKIKQRGVEDCRCGCRCDAANRYLERLKNPQPHDNFT